MLKNLPAMWETWVWSLSWEDPLEKGVNWLPTPGFLPGESHGQRSLVNYSPWGRTDWHDWATNTSHFHFSQGYLRCCLPGLSPKNSHQIKHNSIFKTKQNKTNHFNFNWSLTEGLAVFFPQPSLSWDKCSLGLHPLFLIPPRLVLVGKKSRSYFCD